MLKINILTSERNVSGLLSQLDSSFQLQGIEFGFNSTEDIIWDIVAIYGFDVKWDNIKCRKGNVVFFAPEPPFMFPMQMSFLSQFDHIISCNPGNIHSQNHLIQQCLNWHYAISHKDGYAKYDFESYCKLAPVKTKNISLIMSSKKMMPGHNRRMKIYERLRSDFGDSIDYFGHGINPVVYKEEGIAPYRFHICMENSSIPDYWTEKISDSFIGKAIPIYSGCTNLSKYFGDTGYFQFDIDNYNSLKSIILEILKDPIYVYDNNYKAMMDCRNLLFNRYNIFPFILSFFENNLKLNAKVLQEYSFLTNIECPGYKAELFRIKLIRKVKSLINSFI